MDWFQYCDRDARRGLIRSQLGVHSERTWLGRRGCRDRGTRENLYRHHSVRDVPPRILRRNAAGKLYGDLYVPRLQDAATGREDRRRGA